MAAARLIPLVSSLEIMDEIMNNYKTLKLMAAFAECTKHSQRMLSAQKKVSDTATKTKKMLL